MNWLVEFRSRFVETIEKSVSAEAFNKLQVMKIMELWTVKEGQMIAAMISKSRYYGHGEKYPASGFRSCNFF